MYIHYLFLMLAGLCTVSIEAQSIVKNSVPDWVSPIDNMTSSEVSKYDVNGGAYASLMDSQTNLADEADFLHLSLEVLTDAGVSVASEIAITYDTVYQSAEFHYLYVWRDGERIDRTDAVDFELLRQEQRLNINMYTGLTTAYYLLDDIRKGDRVEYAYTLFGDNPIFEESAYRMYYLQSYNPIDRYYIKVIMGPEQSYDCVGCEEMDLTVEALEDGDKLLVLDVQNLEALEIEESIPSWYIPMPYLNVYTSRDWQEVGDWAKEVFTIADESFADVLKSISADSKDIEANIDRAIDFVQDDIRYMGLENGLGSIRPFHPRAVIDQRFGDCKDKSLLLAKLLQEIGVDMASPTLVSTSLQDKIKDLGPGAQLFDHCITYFEFQGDSYWVDPTNIMQGGNFKTLTTSDFQVALVIEQSERGLIAMDIEDNLSMTRVSETLDASSFTGEAILTVKTYFMGSEADYVRAVLEAVSIRELESSLRGMYSVIYPRIESAEKLQIKDNLESNIISLIESYIIDDIWKDGQEQGSPVYLLHYEPLKLYDYVSSLTCEKKKFPVFINFPSQYEQQTTLIFPESLVIAPDGEQKENEAFTYERLCFPVDGKTMKIQYSYVSNDRQIPAASYQRVCEDMNALVLNLPYEIYFNKHRIKDVISPLRLDEE